VFYFLNLILWLLAAAPALANVVGGDLQNFNAVPGGIDYITVQASETLEPGLLNVSVMGNYAVNTLPYYEDESGTQNRTRIGDTLTMLDFGVGLGVAAGIEAGIAAQDLVKQTVEGGSSHGEFGSSGIINYRVYGKSRLAGDSRGGLALVATAVFNNVKNNPYVGKDASPIGIVELAGDTHVADLAVALNLGYRFRDRGEPMPGYTLQPIGNQYIGSVGVSYLMPSLDTKIVAEIYGARPAARDVTGFNARQASSAEMLLGFKYDVTHALAAHVGGGTELMHGASTPDWRVYAGVNWTVGPVFERRDESELVLRPTATPSEERAILENVNFATGSDAIPPEALPKLEALAKQIKATPYSRILVEGHTDSVGSETANQRLSERRARTVRQWLIDNAGVPAASIEAVGIGEARPIADNGNFQGRRRNRRVEVQVTRKGTAAPRN
jgi:outer membrane protein OmpA-like peptidoglycan-associated protein